jgi:hypothetical protein
VLAGKVIQAPNGSKFFDCNTVVSPQAAALFRQNKYSGAIRYVGRHNTASFDASQHELEGILAANLAIMIVQHVQKPGWVPSGQLGIDYGNFAAQSALAIGCPPGMTLWCDLEGIARGDHTTETIDFCNHWIDQVGHAGFTPGTYIGYEPGLNGVQFYSRTRFEHFWRAYNGDVVPTVRGFQMLQEPEKLLAGIRFDPDTIQADKLGVLPLVLAPDGWND